MRLELTRSNDHYPLKVARLPIPPSGHSCNTFCLATAEGSEAGRQKGEIRGKKMGAKNGTRTRDPDLGKVVLYQLSYFRMMESNSIAAKRHCKKTSRSYFEN